MVLANTAGVGAGERELSVGFGRCRGLWAASSLSSQSSVKNQLLPWQEEREGAEVLEESKVLTTTDTHRMLRNQTVSGTSGFRI